MVYADGNRETYYILGEWDQDETLHIISSQTGMAQALAGTRTGDRVKVPTASGEAVEVEIAAVKPLSEDITNWLNS